MAINSQVEWRSNALHRCPACGTGGSGCAQLKNGLVWCLKTTGPENTPAGWLFRKPLGGGQMGGELMSEALAAAMYGSLDSFSDAVRMRSAAAMPGVDPDEEPAARVGGEALTLEQRAAGFRLLLAALDLEQEEQHRLINERGFTGVAVEQLMREGFRTIRSQTTYPGVQVPGFLEGGTYTGHTGLLIPAHDFQGRVVGAQVAPRPEAVEEGAGKYMWLSREDSPIAIGAKREWPVFLAGERGLTEVVGLVDGALKAYTCAGLYGRPYIGVPGARFVTAGDQLLQVLKRLFRNPRGVRKVLFQPDAGDTVNASGMPAVLISAAWFLQERGFLVRFSWWGQHSKETGLDADERMLDGSGQGTETLEITAAEFAALVEKKTGRRPIPSKKAVMAGVHWLKPEDGPTDLEFLPPPPEPYVFDPGERVQVLSAQAAMGYRHVADVSPTATGKSSWIAATSPKEHEARVKIWVSRRGIDVAGEFGLPYLRAKDGGRTFTEDGRLVRATPQTPAQDIHLAPNCSRGMDVTTHLQRGMALTAGGICEGCPDLQTCKSTPGWAKRDRGWVLEQEAFVCEPESLDPSLFCDANGDAWEGRPDQQPGVVIFLDELGAMPLVIQRSIALEDLNQHLSELKAEPYVDLIPPAVFKVLEVLRSALQDGARHYHCDLMTKLSCALREGEIDADDAVMSGMAEEQAMSKPGSKMQDAWLLELLTALAGGGQLWVENGSLSVMLLNQRLRNALLHPAVKLVTYFDATADTSELEAFLGQEVPVICQRPPLEQGDVQVRQWVGIGRLGYRRQPSQEKQIAALLDDLEAKGEISRNSPIIDIKASEISRGRTRLPITWLGQSRGSNIAKSATEIVLIGAPSANLLSMINRYQLFWGGDHRLEDTGLFSRRFMASNRAEEQQAGGMFVEMSFEHVTGSLRDYLRRKTRADVMQGIGRVRALRRPGETIVVHFISDYCVEDLPVTVHNALEQPRILEAVGLTKDVLDRQIRRLEQNGSRVTCKAIGIALGVRTADVMALARMHIDQYQWLLRYQPRPGSTKAKLPSPQENKPVVEVMTASELASLKRQFPVGSTVSTAWAPGSNGVVKGYERCRGMPKVEVLMSDGETRLLPAHVLGLQAPKQNVAA